jgi:RimJ/RimL family protein N-acetyltransferase
MFPQVSLTTAVSKDDVGRVRDWLRDPEVSSLWYGTDDSDGHALHIGYAPEQVQEASDDEWNQIFNQDERRIYSIYVPEEAHIGEGQLLVEWPLEEAQLFILIGRKDLWHHHYGTSALVAMLDEAFDNLELHRVWVDVPEYNEHALQMFRHLGFVLEGHLRRTHRKDGNWYDSFAMGLLTDEYSRRRSRVLAQYGA